jgi:hypothetical protein
MILLKLLPGLDAPIFNKTRPDNNCDTRAPAVDRDVILRYQLSQKDFSHVLHIPSDLIIGPRDWISADSTVTGDFNTHKCNLT